MAARKKAWTPTRVRERIRVSMLMRRLNDHVLGKCEMSPSQVQAATYLISQSIGKPAQSLVHSGEIGHRHSHELTEAELERIASGSGERAASETASTTEPSSVH
jgi:hypothetical protein